MASVICALTLTGTASTSTISQTAESARKSVNVSLEKQSLGFVEGDHFSVENTAAFQGLVHQFISVTNASKGEFILLFQLYFAFLNTPLMKNWPFTCSKSRDLNAKLMGYNLNNTEMGGEPEWCRESTGFPPMWPGFKS